LLNAAHLCPVEAFLSIEFLGEDLLMQSSIMEFISDDKAEAYSMWERIILAHQLGTAPELNFDTA
uniref:PH domain-containing protein n=1 Tax=Gongylonema pulchrum TaxID=637853 RepID=A0A183DHI5_9BILA